MATETTNYGLYKYEGSDAPDLTKLSASMDKIDTELKQIETNIGLFDVDNLPLSSGAGTITYGKTGKLVWVSISFTPAVVANLTLLATLPEGYKPRQTSLCSVRYASSGEPKTDALVIHQDGRILIGLSSGLVAGQLYTGTAVFPVV